MQTDHQDESTNGVRVVGFLTGLDRRLRRNESLNAIARALWGLVGLVVVLKLAGWWDATLARTILLAAYGVAVAGVIGWRYGRERDLLRSAAVADSRADLKDALKSALSFLGLSRRTDWMELHIDRSADTANALSASELAPTVIPRPLYYAAGAAVALVSLFTWNPGWLQQLERADFLTASQRDRVEHIEELLDQAEALAPDEERLEELSDALEQLRRRDIELSESLQELSEAQEALAASQAEMERLEMDLETLGDKLDSVPGLAELAQALKSQNTKEAAELLRELADRIADAQSSEELQALLESLRDSNLQNQELAEMLENLEQSAGDMSAEDMAKMAQALEAIAQQMESMGNQMAAQQDMEQMGQELQELQASLAGQQTGEQQAGQQQQPGGEAQSQAGMMSNQMQMAQMQGDPSSAVPVDAGPAGDTTGPGGPGGDEVFGEATTLDVQLDMEVLTADEKDEPIPEEIFERLSREEKSTLNYEDVRQPGSYSEESAMQRDSVPWQYRSLVKRYFLSILTNSETTPEP
jgi:hypothetical protein